MKKNKIKKLITPGLIGLISLISHAVNIFKFPEFLGDEGIYVSQGWWLANFGKISPYTYWYDHSPFGWMQIGLWQKLTGGPFTFGLAINSGRILMLIIAIISTGLIFKISKIMTKSRPLAILASLLFALSPLAISYHRQVLLDNLAVFWFLISFYILLISKKKLLYFLISGFSLGLALLSKETMVLFTPAFLFLIFHQSRGKTKPFLITSWLISFIFVILLYPLLAYLKLELLPDNWLPGQRAHVSLVEAILFQGQRHGGHLLNAESDIRKSIAGWLNEDKILPILGVWASLMLITGLKNSFNVILLIMNIFFAFYLLHGGVVLGFYLIPQIALWCLTIPLVLLNIFKKFSLKLDNKKIYLVLVILPLLIIQNLKIYHQDDNQIHLESLSYIRENVSSQSVLIIDPIFYTDLKVSSQNQNFPNAEWVSKAEKDPQIKEQKLEGRWQNINYILLTAGMNGEVKKNNYSFIEKAIREAEIIKTFSKNNHSPVNRLYKIPSEDEFLTDNEKLEKIKQLIISSQKGFGARLITQPKDLETIEFNDLVFIDQEGGQVNRLNELPNVGQAEIKNKNEAFRIAKIRGIFLRRNNVDINLAPVVDINWQESSYINANRRSFGQDSKQIFLFAEAMLKAYRQTGTKTVLKHFPGGLGRTEIDPHQSLPEINVGQREVNKDMAPFAALASKANAVMVTHLFYPQIDPQYPSSLSPIFINGLLRGKLNFQGPVILDDLNMGALADFSQAESIALGLKAGADMFIITQPEKNLEKDLMALIKNKTIDIDFINHALKRSASLH